MRPTHKLLYILSSFAPLFLVISLRVWEKMGIGWWFVLFIVLTFIPSAFLLGIFNLGERHRQSFNIEVKNLHSLESESLTYMVTYFPFLIGIDITNAFTVASYGVFYAIFLIHFMKFDPPVVNPTLIVTSFRIYQAERSDGSHKVWIIHRGELPTQEPKPLSVQEISPGLYICN